jgi:hypothetical protein
MKLDLDRDHSERARRFVPLRRVSSALLLLSAVVFAACSSSSSDSKSAPAEPIELGVFCAELGKARCAGIQKCCPTTTGKYADAESCSQAEQRRCESTMQPVLASAQYVFDAAAAGEYVARVKRSGERCAEPDGSLDTAALLGPGLSPGAACQIDIGAVTTNPCQGTSFCKPTSTGLRSGTCLLTPGEGELCPDALCAAGLGCRSETGGARCRSLPKEGDACSRTSSSSCGPTLRCMLTPASIAELLNPTPPTEPFNPLDPPASMQEYACQLARKNGDATLEPGDCASGLSLVDQASASIRCVACRSHEDCYSPSTGVFEPYVSIDNYSGFCENGVCKPGDDGALPASKPAEAICFAATECRSQTCDRPNSMLGHCGAANLTALFCTVPFAG